MKYNEKEIHLYILVRCNHFRPKAQEEIGQEVNLNTSGAIKQTKNSPPRAIKKYTLNSGCFAIV